MTFRAAWRRPAVYLCWALLCTGLFGTACASGGRSRGWSSGSSSSPYRGQGFSREDYRQARIANRYDLAAWLGEIETSPSAQQRARLGRDLEALLKSETDSSRRAEFVAMASLVASADKSFDSRLQLALERAPDSPLVLGARARYLENRGDAEKSDPLWLRAARHQDAPPFVLEGLARSQIRQRELEDAADTLELFLELRPQDEWALFNLATILLDPLDDPDGAFKILKSLATRRPDDLDVALNYATAALLSRRNEKALQIMKQTAQKFPGEALPQFNLAVYHADHGHNEAQAIRHFERYLELGGEHTLRVERWIRELKKETNS
ncbi:MAG: tetratricopeptide repeat protein [Planctomycetota bacterium]